ncbi:MAG: membrane integrity-associated transporter subunit PqiC, partial [Deltaproteobacteria bacterium]|nr:membrane integrity-associated transporter subunit PqiC [Deltaproteobacteria bacterium]
MRNMFIRLTAVTLTLSILALAGCMSLGEGQTPSSAFYQLNPIAVSSGEGQVEEEEQDLAIAVGPVNFPDYLNRPQIVIRRSQNELELEEFHRWAGPLKENFSSVLG